MTAHVLRTATATDGATLVLVDASPQERLALDDLADLLPCAAAELDRTLADRPDVDMVVLGARASRPGALVEIVRRHSPTVPVLLVIAPDTDGSARRGLVPAAGLPLDVLVVRAVDTLRSQAAAQLARPEVDLGPLLEQAPVGVLVCGRDGSLHGWNRRALALLGLPEHARPARLGDVLLDAVPLLDQVAASRPDDTDGVGLVVVTQDGRHLEISALATEVQGRSAVSLLLVDVTEGRRAERARARLSRQVDLLGRLSESLITTLDVDETLAQLTEVLVPDFADWVAIQLTDELGVLSLAALRHRDPEHEAVIAELVAHGAFVSPHSPSRRAAEGGGPMLVSHVDEEDLGLWIEHDQLREVVSSLGLGSALAVPLPGRDGLLGSMVMVRGPERTAYRQSHLSVAIEAGRRTGIALDNARFHGRQQDLATELQRSLLTAPPRAPHGQVAVRYVAAAHEAQVGGDWYDAFVLPDGATVLVVGDVVGHDRRAAAGMSQIRGVLRGIAYTTEEDPARVLTRADRAMAGLGIRAMATAAVLRLEPRSEGGSTTRISWSSAGHPPPLLLTPGGVVRVLHADGEPDLLLGLHPETRRSVSEADVPCGSTVLLYSDGLVERRDEDFDHSVSRLADALALGPDDESLEQLCDRVIDQLLPVEPEDDVAMVAIRLV